MMMMMMTFHYCFPVAVCSSDGLLGGMWNKISGTGYNFGASYDLTCDSANGDIPAPGLPKTIKCGLLSNDTTVWKDATDDSINVLTNQLGSASCESKQCIQMLNNVCK